MCVGDVGENVSNGNGPNQTGEIRENLDQRPKDERLFVRPPADDPQKEASVFGDLRTRKRERSSNKICRPFHPISLTSTNR